MDDDVPVLSLSEVSPCPLEDLRASVQFGSSELDAPEGAIIILPKSVSALMTAPTIKRKDKVRLPGNPFIKKEVKVCLPREPPTL